jgi:hypothetical protein
MTNVNNNSYIVVNPYREVVMEYTTIYKCTWWSAFRQEALKMTKAEAIEFCRLNKNCRIKRAK